VAIIVDSFYLDAVVPTGPSNASEGGIRAVKNCMTERIEHKTLSLVS
jgi:hypothetical protein